jgi:glutamate carboxypeptidase
MVGSMSKLSDYFETRTQSMVSQLRELVQMESPTREKTAVDALGDVVAKRAMTLGAVVTTVRQEERGDHILARWEGASTHRQILILCHMDTVWPLGTLNELPIRVEDGRFYGPGAYDMKAGLVLAFTAIQGLRALGTWPERPITCLFNSDEELGSRTSRDLIEEEARRSDLVLVLEPCTSDGSIKTSRKGTGRFVVTASGVAAHAGAAHSEGVNAIEELSHQILQLQSMTDYARGTTVNVGRIQGGGRTNVVPAHAKAWIDLRITTPQEGQRMLDAVRGLSPHLPGASLEIQGTLSRPPMERNELMRETFRRASAIAARIGFNLTEGASGGASDGNFSAALDVPTLDGLGALGDGAHALHEHVMIHSLPQRAALLAALLAYW